MRIGVTATRHGLTESQHIAMVDVFRRLKLTELHHGDCVGGDAAAHKAAQRMGARVVKHPASDVDERWKAHCPDADVICAALPALTRNRAIVNDTEFLVAMPREFENVLRSGTWATIRYATQQRRNMMIIYPDWATEVRP